MLVFKATIHVVSSINFITFAIKQLNFITNYDIDDVLYTYSYFKSLKK